MAMNARASENYLSISRSSSASKSVKMIFFSNGNETMFGSGYENCSEFGVLGGVIFKLDIL
jgi:hypothetical protein